MDVINENLNLSPRTREELAADKAANLSVYDEHYGISHGLDNNVLTKALSAEPSNSDAMHNYAEHYIVEHPLQKIDPTVLKKYFDIAPQLGEFMQKVTRDPDFVKKYGAEPLDALAKFRVDEFQGALTELSELQRSPLGKAAIKLDEAVRKHPDLEEFAGKVAQWAMEVVEKLKS